MPHPSRTNKIANCGANCRTSEEKANTNMQTITHNIFTPRRHNRSVTGQTSRTTAFVKSRRSSEVASRESQKSQVAQKLQVASHSSPSQVRRQNVCLFVCLFVGLFVCPCIGQPSSRLSASAMPAKGQNFGRCLKGPKLHQAKHTQPLSSAPLSSALLSSAPLSSAPLSSAPLSSSPS